MVALERPSDVRMLLKKLWCHGQAIAPLQGCAYGFWALSEDPNVSSAFRVLLWVAAAKFPAWGLMSWRALHRRYGPYSFRLLVFFGTIVILLDLLIAYAATANRELSRTWPLVAFVFTCLHAIETAAFLSAVACFSWALVETDDPGLLGYPHEQC